MRYWLIVMLVTAGMAGIFVTLAFGEEPSRQREKAFRAVIGADGVQRVDILAGSYFFRPNHIVVTVNRPAELKVRKEPGIVPHNIVAKSPEAGFDFDVSLESDPQVIRFTPTKTGSYPFYCDKKLLFFESHREKGMEGILEVTP